MESIEYKGHSIEIEQDLTPMNPRIDMDNLGTMGCIHGRYNLGDQKEKYTIEDLQVIEANLDDKYIVLPLFLYDHSGITMNTKGFSCRWDSGQVGIIFVSKEKVRNEYGVKRVSSKLKNSILSYLVSEVETYDDFLTGNVYGYDIDEIDEACSGFFGSDHEKNGLLEYARNAIDCAIKYEGENV